MGELPIAQGTTDDMKIAMLLGYAALLLCDSRLENLIESGMIDLE